MVEVAILLTTYNSAEYLVSLLDSIKGQSYKNWQIYIRDDVSEDNTIEIIDSFVSLDERIHFFFDDF